MAQANNDERLLEFCIKNIIQLEEEIYRAQRRLAFYREMRDLLADELGVELD